MWRSDVGDEPLDPRAPIDPRINTAAREGLSGTAPANLYLPVIDPEQITRAPDGRPHDRQPRWRQDFPIDLPHDQYVARRDFMTFMVLTSAAFAAGQVWIAAQNWLRRRQARPEIVPVARLDDIAIGSATVFTYPGPNDRCLLMRPAADVVLAFSQACTHLSCAVVPRMDEGRIYCPCHDGVFDMQSGRPLAGPPQRPLTRIAVDVRQGTVYATGVEPRTV
jgi:nitrite reductase/ring-hydroxylating ferredoxin subunit